MNAARALVADLIDYAGLFAPAGLPMDAAVANYARYRDSEDAWALGRFIVPVARLDEFARTADPHFAGEAWSVSALGSDDPAADRAAIDRFNATHAGRAAIDAVELKTTTRESIAAAAVAFHTIATYCEIGSISDPGEMIAEVRRAGLRAKIRTGGVTADAFPYPMHVVRFIRRCIEHGVAFKATAGLHHPLRCVRALTYERDAPHGTMHGFLNVFLAAAAMRQGLGDDHAIALLLDDDLASFGTDEEAIWWRDVRLDAAQIADARGELAIGFGSCSFEEPVGELREIGWL